MCYNSCNECPRKVFSSAVAVNTGATALNITLPAQSFNNNQRGCLVIVQNIPTAATISMPVNILIGTDTTEYPVTDCTGRAVTASALRTRRRYPFRVVTTATGGSFQILRNLSCAPNNQLASIGGT